MAGQGTRYTEAGYHLPKPLLPVSGAPMFHRAIESLPKADKWIFVVRHEHVKEYSIDNAIKEKLPKAKIIIEDKPWGQAPSADFALKDVDDNEEVLIAACDNAFLFDQNKYNQLIKRPDVDMIMWTFTQDKLLSDNPTAWGWIKLAADNETIEDMSVKVPVSDSPFNDHAVVATFYFKKIADFKAAYQKMVEADYKINNEFYVDSMPVFLRQLNKKSIIFDVDLYVGWGKPSDLHDYELFEYQYKYQKDKLDPRWVKYFDTVYAKN